VAKTRREAAHPSRTFVELRNLPDEEFFSEENREKFRSLSPYEKFMALKGRIHIQLDIDEARGRHRR